MTEFKFGIFDWIDFSDPWRLAESYDQRFEMLKFAEQHGYWCYHLAEHHFSSLGGAPSPSVFLAAAATVTSTLRIGSLVHILPMYSTVRLAQEVIMLDHLTRGRFELGLGRGIRPEELKVTNIDPERVREVYDEAFGILLKELAKCGAVRVIYVDENEAAAIRDARQAYGAHAAAFTELHRLHSPIYDSRNATGSPYEDFEEQCRRGWLLVGTPAQVRERILEQIDATGINYMIGAFAFGAMSTAQLLNSLGLFSEEVLPSVRQLGRSSVPA